MTQPARPDPARTPSRNDHARPGPAPSGCRRPGPVSGRHPGPARRRPACALYLACSGAVVRAARGTARSPRGLADMTRVWPGQPGRLQELPRAGAARQHAGPAGELSDAAGAPALPGSGVDGGLGRPGARLGDRGLAGRRRGPPASYSPIRKTVSVLAGHAGTDRWIMTGALLLVGGCQLVTAAGLASVRVPARIVLAVAGLSSIGIALSPEPARGSTPQHLAWTSLGAVTLAIWPALLARRAPPRPLILSSYGCAVVTAVFIVLLGWLIIQTQGGTDLGLAERVFLSTETCWPFIVAITLRQTTG